MPAPPSPWLHVPRPLDAPRARLFCFPYAGGTAANFHAWANQLAPTDELCALQYPGRASRLAEEPVRDQATLLEALADAITTRIDRPYVLFGHSFGARVAFSLARLLHQRGQPLPAALIASGSDAPHHPHGFPRVHHLDDEAFAARLHALGALPDVVMQTPELLELSLPALRADFELVEHWQCAESPSLPLPLTVLRGRGDPYMHQAAAEHWAELTSGPVQTETLDGDHYFVRSAEREVLGVVKQALAPLR